MVVLKQSKCGCPVSFTSVTGLVILASFMLLAASVSYAGDIAGVVSDSDSGRFLEGASIAVAGSDQRVVADRWGRYSLKGMAAGDYTLEVITGGYEAQSVDVTVPDTGQVALNIELGSAYLEEVVVQGARISQMRALQRKRSAPSILDAISADDVGKLPDFNAAEAIQRLPGITVEIDQGEGRYSIIRGIDSNLNNVTIDGNIVGAPEGAGRRVALDVIPSELISVIEVIKAITPDLDGNAIGGNINIVTRSAFDTPEPFASISVRAGYNDMAGRVPYGASGSWGSTMGENDAWGLVLAGSYYVRSYETELLEGRNWEEVTPGNYTVEQPRLQEYDIERERIGVDANIEYRPSDDKLWYFRTIFNEFTDEEERNKSRLDLARGDQTIISDTVVANSKGRVSREYRQNNQTQRLFNISTGGELVFDNKTWSASYTYSHAEEITPQRIDWEYRSGGSAFPNTVDVSDFFFQYDAGPNINDPAEFDFRRNRRRSDAIEDDIHSVKTDLKIDNIFKNRPGFVQFGAKYATREKFQDRENHNYEGDFTLADSGLYIEPQGDLFGGRYDFGPMVDFPAHEALFRSSPELFEFDPESSAIDSVSSDYEIEEDLWAAYGMFSVDVGNTTILGGVRVEHTDATYNAYFVDLDDFDVANPATPTSVDSSYTDWLPSLHITHRPSDNTLIRAAWTNTIGRPNFESVAPRFELEDGEGSAGNPALKPFESMGLDLSYEYYFEPSGIISVGVFYKDIKNPIFTRRTDDVIFNGIPLDELSQPENADSGNILGLELNYQQQFVNLPKPWDGLGVSMNLTFMDSEVDVFGREDDNLSFVRQPDKLGNFAVFYAINKWEARVALNYRDAYLESISSNNNDDIYFDERTQVDFKLTYFASDKVTIFGDVQNVTNESRGEYQGVPSRLFAQEVYGWTALLGATYTF